MTREPAPPGARRPLRGRFRRPVELVERTRWLFFVCVLASLAVTVPAGFKDPAPWPVGLLVLSSAAFLLSWLHRYRTRRTSVLLDASEVLAAVLFALACPQPAVAFGVTFPALWFRAVYGTRRRYTAYALCLTLAVATAVWAWPLVPGHTASIGAAEALSALPVMLLNSLVVRHLVDGLFERDNAQARDATLARLGTQLLGVTDVAHIKQRGWEAAEEFCRVTPGLRAVLVSDDGDRLHVLSWTGALGEVPTTLARTQLAGALTAGVGEPLLLPTPPELVGAEGKDGRWIAFELTGETGQYLLLGGDGALPTEGVVAVRSLLNQVALAIRATSAHRELEVQARTDALTGLANRIAFSAALETAGPTPAGSPWVLFVDLDDFKVVNDQLGHAAGDELLRSVGARLAGTVREPGLCARLGGDEFAVLVHAVDAVQARALGQRLVEVASAPVRLAEGTARVGASAGAARIVPGIPWTETLRHADLAMYAAKAAGKNRVQVCDPSAVDDDEVVPA